MKLQRFSRVFWTCLSVAAALTFAAAFRPSGPQTLASLPGVEPTPNYDLAARWTSQQVGKLVFDSAVTPHWFDTSDKFWYSFKTSTGTAYYVVDPARGSKAALFDHAMMAEQLTRLTGIPFDGEHLPLRNLKLIRKDTVLEFDLDVPRTAVIAGLPPETATAAADAATVGGGGAGRGGRGAAGGAATPPPAGTRAVHFELDLAAQQAKMIPDYKAPVRPAAWATLSPDGKTVVFARGFNLYMMDAANFALAQKNVNDPAIVETQLTTDGEKDYSFTAEAMRPTDDSEDLGASTGGAAGGGRGGRGGRGGAGAAAQRDTSKNPRQRAIRLVWSRDSSRFILTRTDERKVADLWVIHTLHSPRPTLETYKYAMPGEVNVPLSELWMFDVAAKKATPINATGFADQRITIQTELVTEKQRNQAPEGVTPPSIWMGGASDHFYISRMSRDMHKLDYCVVNTADGTVKPIIEERSNVDMTAKPLRLVNRGTEFLLWSERDGWGHYYLYGTDGALKNQVDKGEFMAANIISVDDATGTLYFNATGYKAGEDVYYNHLYRIGLDGTGMRAIGAANATHAIHASDDNQYFVDTYSRVDLAPESVLYNAAGATVAKLESTDVKALLAAGFQYPEPFSVKADDGITDLYGVMFKPFDFDPHKKYPLIEFVYPGPQTEEVDTTFTPGSAQMTLAQFGFIVIEVGNRGGSPERDAWYHTYGYGNLRDYGLADKKRVAEELAAAHSYIDVNRVGITGHSGGGFMSSAAMLVYPDFFKVAVSESGNHDNNVYNNTWGEQNNGIHEVDSDDGKATFDFSVDKNSDLARNLKGHLLLATGDMDNNVHMANTMLLANALIRANKRFDIFILPGERHHYASDLDYFFWRKADYFCQYLLGSAPRDADLLELQREVAATGKAATTGAAGRGGDQGGDGGGGNR